MIGNIPLLADKIDILMKERRGKGITKSPLAGATMRIKEELNGS